MYIFIIFFTIFNVIFEIKYLFADNPFMMWGKKNWIILLLVNFLISYKNFISL